ncbi:VPS10 domain-containing protein [Wenyingzhuangia sp. IMCC45574]
MKKIVWALLACMQTIGFAQNNAYFKKLQTERIESDNRVQWTLIGPGNSGYSEDLFIHPTDANTMFVNYDMGNAYRTNNKSKSWVTLNDFDGKGSDIRPNWITFSTEDENFGLMLTKGQLNVTYNKGINWLPVKSFPGKKKNSVIAIDPNDKDTWYVGGGQYWKVKDIHRSLKKPHGTKSNNTDYGQIFKTTNAGKTWKRILTDVSKDLDVGRIIVDPNNSKNVFALTNYGLYKSKNGGKSWVESSNGLPYNNVRDLTSYYSKRDKQFYLYCVLQTTYSKKGKTTMANGGVYISKDNGENWKNITGNLSENYNLQKISLKSKSWLYYRTIGYWFGEKMGAIRKELPEFPSKTLPVFNRIAVSPKNPNEIYISNNLKHDFSFGPGELMKTLDGGKTWTVALRAGKYWGDKLDADYWKATGNKLGINAKFAHLEEVNEHDGTIGVRLMQTNADGEIIICYEQQHLISKDHGETWHQIDDDETSPGSGNWVGRGDSNLPGFGLNLNTNKKGEYFFYTEEHGIWQTTLDGDKVYKGATALKQIEGQSIDKKENSVSITALTIDPNDSKTIYTLTNRQRNAGCFRKSTDGGKTWITLSKPIEKMKSNHLLYLFSIVVDKDAPNTILFCVPSQTERGWHTSKWVDNHYKYKEFKDYGVYKSTDGGKTWGIKNIGLPKNLNVTHLTYDNNYNELYASLATSKENVPGGLYKSGDNGESWNKIKLPNGVTSVKFTKFDKNGVLYIATGDGITNVGKGGVYRSFNNGEKWEQIFNMPNTNRIDISEIDPNYIGVVVAPNRKVKLLNPGIYISRDGGKSWNKSNKGLGQPDKIEGFGFDPFDKNIFWSASHGSGFAKGVFKE